MKIIMRKYGNYDSLTGAASFNLPASAATGACQHTRPSQKIIDTSEG
jgi:hypothetical protein